jgi:hypothetical protein
MTDWSCRLIDGRKNESRFGKEELFLRVLLERLETKIEDFGNRHQNVADNQCRNCEYFFRRERERSERASRGSRLTADSTSILDQRLVWLS